MKLVLASAYSDPLDYLALARGAEANGFEAIAVSDHVVHAESPRTPYPYTAELDALARFRDDVIAKVG